MIFTNKKKIKQYKLNQITTPKKLSRIFLIVISCLSFSLFLLPKNIFAGKVGGMNTVYIIPNPMVKFSIEQKYENTINNDYLLIRNFNLFLNIASKLELSANIPYINSRYKNSPDRNRLGDVVISVNQTTKILKKYALVNFIYSFNFGSGNAIEKADTNPLEAYGHEEFRFGILFMKNFKKFSFSGDIEYYFRTEQGEDMFRGFTVNVFSSEGWKRWFGFNPSRKENFFYQGKLRNDNLVYKLALGQYYTYPFTTFFLLDFRHDFTGDARFDNHKKAPGYYSRPLWLSLGSKYFFNDELNEFQFVLKAAVNSDARDYSSWGAAVMFSMEF